MKKQALTLAIAAALSAPSALAAQDTSGMRYTSAAEGFYASLRLELNLGSETKDGKTKSDLNGGTSRIGVRGSNDLGHGLEGFYQWEGQIGVQDGKNSASDNVLRTRLGHVGLRGAFGEVVLGSFWTNDYNWTHSASDVANTLSGYLNYTTEREGRSEQAIQYTTPDLNGFKGALRVRMGDNKALGGDTKDANDVDLWNLAGTYSVQGFTVGASYNVVADGQGRKAAPYRAGVAMTSARCINPQGVVSGGSDRTTCGAGTTKISDGREAVAERGAITADREDLKSWTVRLGYAQDNWYVNGWYGNDNTGDNKHGQANNTQTSKGGCGAAGPDTNPTTANVHDAKSCEDSKLLGLAAGVSIDKVRLYAAYDTKEDMGGQKDTYGLLGAQYLLGAQSRVLLEYQNRDLDTDKKTKDQVVVGMRHDF